MTSAHLCVSGIPGNVGGAGRSGAGPGVPFRPPFPSVLARAPLPLPDGLQCPPHPQKVFKQSCDPQPCSSSPDEQTSWKNVVSAYPQCPSAKLRRKGARGYTRWKELPWIWNHYKTFRSKEQPQRGLQKVQRPQSCSLGFSGFWGTQNTSTPSSPAPEASERHQRGWAGAVPGSCTADPT